MKLWQELARWAKERPEHLAVLTPEHQLTYAQLHRRSYCLANQLTELSGHRIAVHTNDPIEMAIAFYGIVRSGKNMVIVDPAWPSNLATSMVSRLRCDLSLTSWNSLSHLGRSAQSGNHESPLAETPVETATDSSDTHGLLVICTSGSSSYPKPVLRTFASWEQSLNCGADILGATPIAATLCPGPISHGLGLYAMIESLHTGGTFLATGKWDPTGVRTLVEKTICTRIVTVPTILSKLLSLLEPELLSNLRTVVSGGEALNQDTVRELYRVAPRVQCLEYFGSSEHSLIAYRERGLAQSAPPHFDGQLFPGVRAHIHEMDPQTGFGQLYVDSPFNSKGYDPSSETNISRCGSSICIGDRARIEETGRIMISRRDDQMLNLNGNNIHTGEVSAALEAVGLPNAIVQLVELDGTPTLVAYTVDPPKNPATLLAELQAYLPQYKVPHQIIYLRAWPESFSGKLKTKDLNIQHLEIQRSDDLR